MTKGAKHGAVPPTELKATLDVISRLASSKQLLAEYTWAFNLAYPGAPSSRHEGGSSRGKIAYSDPTLSALDADAGEERDGERRGDPGDLRRDLKRFQAIAVDVAKQVDVAQRALGAAMHALRPSKDVRQDLVRETKPLIHPDELEQAHKAQAQRHAAGGGFGES